MEVDHIKHIRTKSTYCQEVDEKEFKIHFPAIDAEVAVLTRGHAVCTGVKVAGPFLREGTTVITRSGILQSLVEQQVEQNFDGNLCRCAG